MSTRSLIGYMETGSEEVYYIYCHYDGYPSHNGVMLNECYNTIDKVKELVDKGNISSLSTHIKGVKYYENEPTKKCDAWDYNYKDCGYDVEYLYLFKEETNTWVVESIKGVENLDEVLHDYETFLKIEGGKYVDDKKEFDEIQENIEAIKNLYQSWDYNDNGHQSTYIPAENVVEFCFKQPIGWEYDSFNIPCENREQAMKISNDIIGKSFIEVAQKYGFDIEYHNFEITSEDTIFNNLKECALQDKWNYIDEDEPLSFKGTLYQGEIRLFFENGVRGGEVDNFDKNMIKEYLNNKQIETQNIDKTTPSHDDEER